MASDVTLSEKVSPAKSGGPTVFALLDEYRGQIARALPTGTSGIERFVRIVRTELQREPKLHAADGHSFLGAVLTMASLGLEPGPALGQAWLLPFKNTKAKRTDVQLIIGYRGYTLLAIRSGLVSAIDSEVIYAKDAFMFRKGSEQAIEHNWPLEGERGDLVGAWAMAEMATGAKRFEVLRKPDIERRRQSSRARDQGPWVTDYPQMARKSAVRALTTQLPLSVEMAAAERADEAVRRDLSLPLEEYGAGSPDEGDDDATVDAEGTEDETTTETTDARTNRPEPTTPTDTPPAGEGSP